ncbi:molybdopterin-dependent oxidoreductase [Sulfurimonas sp. SAG-AH-194-L11]|nr:molybdopterin-dependent oxidoreductase [Sulfurimonas sp. SAG-AH-194-L11]MDF1877040.1 molybdopterin-dependent oxidoreductase [Sulfurimonas sp. SAG-AH-194-L11]
MNNENIVTIDSVCAYCGVGCDIAAHVDTKENKIKKIFAHPDGATSEGNLCVKGKYGFDFVDSKARITKPRIRKSFLEKNPDIKAAIADSLTELDDTWYESDVQNATTAGAMKLKDIQSKYGRKSVCSLGGARSSCESAYYFQKFTRYTLNSPHVDNCARVCHSPSLKGMRLTIGEGAASNPFDDIYKTEFMIVMGSNTTEAHPIVANRMIKAAQAGTGIACFDVREIKLHKFSKYKVVAPHESNLLVLNMIAYTIITEELYAPSFIEKRTKNWEHFKENILADPYANPEFFRDVEGFEYLADMLPEIAREYASKKSLILWGLGITEHVDGSYAVMAIVHLALMTGNIGLDGAGVMPLRGQTNVQGVCDMGMLPYYAPDYQAPREVGLMTPQLVDGMIDGTIKGVLNIGEDLTHIHPNLNKIKKAFENVELIFVQELFMTDIARRADIVVGVKSIYEKTGVYINAMRKVHLSTPLVKSDLPDDWEIIKLLDEKMGGGYDFNSSEDIWEDVRKTATNRFKGASYKVLRDNEKAGISWPIKEDGTGTPVLHREDFRTQDGIGAFRYKGYELSGMVEEILNKRLKGYHLTTGRAMAHYNNSAQTKYTEKLAKRYTEDLLLVHNDDAADFPTEKVILKTEFGQTNPLRVKFTDKVRPKTLYTTFHHEDSKLNNVFGDKSDVLIMTAAFKSIQVEIISVA